MLTLADYWMGRDRLYASHLRAEIIRNADITVRKVSTLLHAADLDGIEPGEDQVTGTAVSSGWRPPAVNDRTANAAAQSTHLTGEGVDLQDHADRRLAAWCCRNLHHLINLGLYLEDPRWTGGRDPWVHLQTRAPRSNKRIFVPSLAAPNDPTFFARIGQQVPK